MYLARISEKGKTRYIIRQSYSTGRGFESRDLFDLGDDPARHIVYAGNSGYYYTAEVEEALTAAGTPADQAQLDEIFYDFLKPHIRRVIDGFDRNRRRSASKAIVAAETETALWDFDKRRFHYLRFGLSDQRHIDRVPEKVFRTLHAKSRDELEQYFLSAERLLRSHEKPVYSRDSYRRLLPTAACASRWMPISFRGFVGSMPTAVFGRKGPAPPACTPT